MRNIFRSTIVPLLSVVFLLSGCTQEGQKDAVIIKNWGPRSTQPGVPFNKQADGTSTIWVEQNGITTRPLMQFWFGTNELKQVAVSANSAISAVVPASLFSKSGEYEIYFILLPEGRRIDIGKFKVE